MFSEDVVDIKQEPPDKMDEDLRSILNNDVQLVEVDHDRKNISNIIPSEVTNLLSDENKSEKSVNHKKEKTVEKKTNGNDLKANLKCKFTFCNFRARKILELERHEAKHSIPGSYYECKFCKFMTPVYQKLQEHEAKHTNTKPFKCRKCSYRSRYRADIYHHSAKHLVDKKFKCPHEGCNFLTKWRRNIHHHVLTHTDDRPHECKICDYKFKRVQDLKYHLYRHNDVKPISCDQCDFRCKTNYELGCHKLKHSSVRNYPCTFPGCSQRTKTKSDLTKHMKTHSKVRDHLCPMCGKGFHMRNSLTKHIERHQDVRNYQCALCNKAFKTKATLRAHMQVHSGIKPWTCNICSRDFLNKWNMMKHKETHGENRPFKCPICPYGARVGEHLLAHIGTMHGKSFAYYCEICKKPWKRFSQLQIHMKRMHKGALQTSFGSSMKMDIKLEPGLDGDIATGCDLISVKKIDPTNPQQFNHKRGRPPKIKKEPLEEVSMGEGEGHRDPVLDVVKAIASHRIVPTPTPTDPLSVQTKHEIPTDIGPAKIVSFGEFRLPLATKGFPFNYDKNGKKPNSWFMNPENMHGKAADKQQAYLEKKERDFERKYGRKLGWRRFRLRNKPKPGVSFTKVSNREKDVSSCIKEETDSTSHHSTKKLEAFENSDSKQEGKYNVNGKTTKRKQDPMELLIEGRKKLILMRKIKRRQKRWKQRMAEIMSDEHCGTEGLRESDDHKDRHISDENQQSAVKLDESSDQDDDIPLSRLKTIEDLDDIPLSLLRRKAPENGNIVTKGSRDQKPLTYSTFSTLLEGRLLKQPPKPRKNKRQLQNSVTHKRKIGEKTRKRKIDEKTKKIKLCHDVSAVLETNFYSGSVRILSKTLEITSQLNQSENEKNEVYKNVLSSPSTNQSDGNLSSNESLLKLKGNKIENIVAKLKAKKFGSEFQNMGTSTEENTPGRKKAGRPKGSKNKVRMNHDLENESHSTVSQKSSLVNVSKQSLQVQKKSRRGRPKGSKNKIKIDPAKTDQAKIYPGKTYQAKRDPAKTNKVKSDYVITDKVETNETKTDHNKTDHTKTNLERSEQIKTVEVKALGGDKPVSSIAEQHSVLKHMLQNVGGSSRITEIPTLILNGYVKPEETKCVQKQINGGGSSSVLEGKDGQPSMYHSKPWKLVKPKGLTKSENKNEFLPKTTQKAIFKTLKCHDSEIKSTLVRGKVCKVVLDKFWDLSKKINKPYNKGLNSKQCSQNTKTKIHKCRNAPFKAETPKRSKSGKCKESINFQLKNKLLDKIAKQQNIAKMSNDADAVLCVQEPNSSSVSVSPNHHSIPIRKVGRPKSSTKKMLKDTKIDFCVPEQNHSLVSVSRNRDSIPIRKVGRPKSSTKKMLKDTKIDFYVPKQNHSLVSVSENQIPKRKVGRPKKIASKKVNSKQGNKAVTKQKRKVHTKAEDNGNTKKIISTKKLQTIQKVKLPKLKYQKNFKNRTGINKLQNGNKKVKKGLKMKFIKDNKQVSMLKRKKFVCALGNVESRRKNTKKPSEYKQVWYIDIERDNMDETAANMTLAKSEPSDIFMHTVPQTSLQTNKSLFSSEIITEDNISNINKSKLKQNLIKLEPSLSVSEYASSVPYTLKSEISENFGIYLEHAKAWGVGQASANLQQDGSTSIQIKDELLVDEANSSHLSFPCRLQVEDHMQSDICNVHCGTDTNVEPVIGNVHCGTDTNVEPVIGNVHCGTDTNAETDICNIDCETDTNAETALEAAVSIPTPSFNPSMSDSSSQDIDVTATLFMIPPNCISANEDPSGLVEVHNDLIEVPDFEASSDNVHLMTSEMTCTNDDPFSKPNTKMTNDSSGLLGLSYSNSKIANIKSNSSILSCLNNQMKNMESNDPILGYSDYFQMANTESNHIVSSLSNSEITKVGKNILVSSVSDSPTETAGHFPSNMNSEMTNIEHYDPFLSDPDESSSLMVQPNSEMENNGLVSSDLSCGLTKIESSSPVLGSLNTLIADIKHDGLSQLSPQIKNDDLVLSVTKCVKEDKINYCFNKPISNCVQTSDNQVVIGSDYEMENSEFIVTQRKSEKATEENDDYSATGFDHDDKVQKDHHSIIDLYSQVVDNYSGFVTKPSNIEHSDISDHVVIASNLGVIASGHGVIASDHGVIASDHGVIASDHGVIASDHGVIASDHGVIGSDHGVIASDHGVIASENGVIASDHGVIGSEHGVIASDHGVIASDHCVIASDHCVIASDHELDDELFLQTSQFHSVGDMSFKVVLADSDIEQDLISDTGKCKSSAIENDAVMFKSSLIKTEMGSLPEKSVTMKTSHSVNCGNYSFDTSQAVNCGNYSFSVEEAGSLDGSGCVLRGNEDADHAEASDRWTEMFHMVLADRDTCTIPDDCGQKHSECSDYCVQSKYKIKQENKIV